MGVCVCMYECVCMQLQDDATASFDITNISNDTLHYVQEPAHCEHAHRAEAFGILPV